MSNVRCVHFFVLFLFVTVVLTACGGGGGSSNSNSSNATALRVAEKVSVVDPQLSGTVASATPLRIGVFKVTASQLPADSDYNTDETEVYVEERSVEAFNIVNEILCMIAQTEYDAMLNAGPYTAQVDLSQCDSDKDDASSAGQQSQNQSSSSNMPEYEMWTVDSSRVNDNSPHIVKVWVNEKGGEVYGDGSVEPDKLIYVKAEITEGVGSTNPYGLFAMNFLAHPVVNGTVDTANIMFKGILKSEKDANGKILLKFATEGCPEPDCNHTETATLDRAADGSTGGGSLYTSSSYVWNGTTYTEVSSYDIAYNANYFLRKDTVTNGEVCLSRNDFDESAWMYGLYDSGGGRVSNNSGFSIKTTQNNVDYYGWIGYWGLWMPEGVTLANGDTVYQVSYDSQGEIETPYEIFISGGKLRKHTRKQLTLGDIKNVPLSYYDWDPNTGMGTEYRVYWDGAQFLKTAQMDETNWTWIEISPAVAIDLGHLLWADMSFWSESLGGNASVMLENCTWNDNATPTDYTDDYYVCTASDATGVVFYAEDIVYPSTAGVPTNLACFENCPDPANIDAQDPYFPANWDTTNMIQYDYTFDQQNMVLKYSSTPVVVSSNSQSEWGVWTGALFDPNADDDGDGIANINELGCDWNPAETCPWMAYEVLDVYYSWETGLDDWNRFTALKDANGNFLTFDPPIYVDYVHEQTDVTADDYKYNGTTFYLEYNGFGDLWGIPGVCADMDTGDVVENCDGDQIRWVPEFTIPDVDSNGDVTVVSSVNDNGNTIEYFVKALEIEQRMKEDPTGCTGLSVTPYALPDLTEWQDPNIGAQPTVDGPPAVIAGEIQIQ